MHEKDIKDNSLSNTEKNLNSQGILEMVPKQRLIKRAEKISAAVFLVTNFLNDQEPLKWSIRKAALKTISSVSKIFSGDYVAKRSGLNDAKDGIVELSSLIDIASLAGMISSMNSSILSKELADTLSAVEREETSPYRPKSSRIPQDFFEPKNDQEDLSTEDENLALPAQKTAENHPRPLKDKNAPSAPKLNLEKPKAREYGSVAIKRNKRQSFIIQALKKKKDLTIKDISMIFHDCSEKTIQRELAALVEEGVVVRDGERRWTTYSLALSV